MKSIKYFLTEQISNVNVSIKTSLGDIVKIKCEMVNSDDDIVKGLMGRFNLDEKSGMLFVFPKEKDQEFWMKDTKIPLDIIFIRENKYITGIVENTVPESLKPINVESPSKYIIEVNAGFCDRNGIRRGDKIFFDGDDSDD